ncbi:preprotein translocase subunit YajC [Acinetobacter brisouii]|jgi:ABC-type spermidine/putrescine transport system permease subunit II|nr:preprotein translocase subunit YajC [Acinetobacter brisouii]
MFEHLSKNYELGLLAYVLTYVVFCIPITYVIYKVRKEQRNQNK